MNKRRYPYDFDLCPQLKIHVGDKEIANGVLGPSKMSEVHEYTKQLLFKRAGASFETVAQSTISDRVPRDYKPSRQLQITFDGKLFKPSSPIENSTMFISNQQKCNFCSQTGKLDTCEKCREVYCDMCSLSLYTREMNKICLSCYK